MIRWMVEKAAKYMAMRDDVNRVVEVSGAGTAKIRVRV